MKAILVTGASTGIGRLITETLAQNGFYVYAGARKQKDLDDLERLENVSAIKLDVNDLDQIENVLIFIKSQGRGLFGLVNNAGVTSLQPLIEISDDDFDWVIKTNLYGPYRLTKAISSFLIESKGRIVNIGSISGILSSALLGPYSMTKHAIEAFTDCLSMEMEEFEVLASAIEPGDFESELEENYLSKIDHDTSKLLETQFSRAKEYYLHRFNEMDSNSLGAHPLPVAEAVLDALSSSHPKSRYLVVPNQDQAEMTIRKALKEAVQLNHNQPYSYNREELIAFLDEVLFDLKLL